MRHSCTRSLFDRKDVVVVASVSCIYGLGLPEDYLNSRLHFACGQQVQKLYLLPVYCITMTVNRLAFIQGMLQLPRGMA